MLGNKILIEFDEPHHYTGRQSRIDLDKEKVAKQNGFLIFRASLDMDIIDIIVFVEKNLTKPIFCFDYNKINASQK